MGKTIAFPLLTFDNTRTVKNSAKAASSLLLSLLAGCSNNWTAAMQLTLDAGSARQPLTVRLQVASVTSSPGCWTETVWKCESGKVRS